jgi:hypothetical protein
VATTGFWPVKGTLKDVIEYAGNPDKTTDNKYLDDDLAKALEYVANDDKTDKKLYVSTINCPKQRAYESMMTTKQRFGKLGGNVAYHGFQSFKTGEVMPEEAHEIGMETARRMWGNDYEIVVTTHLNTDNLHNHIVVNSVSFKTGRKFENHISDHHRLREISDGICRERGKFVLEHSSFYGGEKGAYWIHKSGGMTHRDILKTDIEEVLKYSRKYDDMIYRLKALGYQLDRTDDRYQHLTIKAKDWKRPIRLDSIGYTREIIEARFDEHYENLYFFQIQNAHPQYKPKEYPLLKLERELDYEITHSHDTAVVLMDIVFYLILQLLNLAKDDTAREQRRQPLSPSIRMELTKLDQIQKEYLLLADNHIHSAEELSAFMSDVSDQIHTLEQERQHYRNQIRRCRLPETEAELKEKCKDLSAKMNPLQKQLRTANSIAERYPKLQELLKTEREMEITTRNKERDRSR